MTAVDYRNFPRSDVFVLCVISLLIAAKLEEAISPSYLKMISLLSEAEQKTIDKEMLVDLELKILTTLEFNFNLPGPC